MVHEKSPSAKVDLQDANPEPQKKVLGINTLDPFGTTDLHDHCYYFKGLACVFKYLKERQLRYHPD